MTTLPNVSGKYGAPMGRSDSYPDDRNAAIALEIERLIWVDGDYDQGGCYWGHVEGDYIWRFTGSDGENRVEVFIRARTETEALAKLGEDLPNAVVQCNGLEDMFAGYVRAALWSSTDDAGCPMDDSHDESDLSPGTVAKMRYDCAKFLAANRELLNGEYSQAGHDFWLTRNHHGCGFWDGDWEEHGDALTDAAHEFGESDLYVGDDGKIHQS